MMCDVFDKNVCLGVIQMATNRHPLTSNLNRIPTDDFYITQWEAYETQNVFSVVDALNALLDYAKKKEIEFIEDDCDYICKKCMKNE